MAVPTPPDKAVGCSQSRGEVPLGARHARPISNKTAFHPFVPSGWLQVYLPLPTLRWGTADEKLVVLDMLKTTELTVYRFFLFGLEQLRI